MSKEPEELRVVPVTQELLAHLTGYADELYEQGDGTTADAIYALLHERDTLLALVAERKP